MIRSASALAAACLFATAVQAAPATPPSKKPAATPPATAATPPSTKPASGGSPATPDSGSSGTASSGPVAANNARPSIAVFGLFHYGAFGIGARVEYPVALNVLKEVPYRNDLFVVGGLEYYTQSYGGFGGNYRVNYIRIDAGAMWNFWFLENFAAYPKLTLGYDAAWFSGFNNAFGSASYGGITFELAGGVIYNLNSTIQLRGEIGSSSLKAGVGFHFL